MNYPSSGGTPAVNSLIRGMKTLPPAPQILPRLLAQLCEDDVDAARVVELVSYDAGLTVRVLQVCNSAALGGAQKFSDLSSAITRLGFSPIYEIVASEVSGQVLGSAQAQYGIGRGELWRHSAATALIAATVARACGLNESLLFTAGLLHDVGKLVLNEALEQADRASRPNADPFPAGVDAEREILGVDHAEVGGRLMQLWNFPHELAEGIGFHHAPAAAGRNGSIAAGVHLANTLAHSLGFRPGGKPVTPQVHPDSLATLKLNSSDLGELGSQAKLAVQASPLLRAA